MNTEPLSKMCQNKKNILFSYLLLQEKLGDDYDIAYKPVSFDLYNLYRQ